MATFGNATTGSDLTGESMTWGLRATAASSGTGVSITIIGLHEGGSNNQHSVKCGLYDTSGNLLAQTETRNDITTTPADIVFEFESAPTIVASTEYDIAMSVGGGSNIVRWSIATGSSSAGRIDTDDHEANGGNMPATLDFETSGNYGHGFYVTYTETASVGLLGQICL